MIVDDDDDILELEDDPLDDDLLADVADIDELDFEAGLPDDLTVLGAEDPDEDEVI